MLAGIGGGVVKSILVVHIVDQHRGAVEMDQAGQHQAGEEGLASASGAEYSGGTLDKLIQVEADGMALLASIADGKVAAFFGFAEDFGDIAGGGQPDWGMVSGDGLNRQWAWYRSQSLG